MTQLGALSHNTGPSGPVVGAANAAGVPGLDAALKPVVVGELASDDSYKDIIVALWLRSGWCLTASSQYPCNYRCLLALLQQ